MRTSPRLIVAESHRVLAPRPLATRSAGVRSFRSVVRLVHIPVHGRLVSHLEHSDVLPTALVVFHCTHRAKPGSDNNGAYVAQSRS